MLEDLLNSNNYLMINLTSVQVLGLRNTVYIAELLNIHKKAAMKDKLIDEEYFKVDREFIATRTSLSIDDQLKCDLNLSKVGIIKKHKEDPDVIKLDTYLYAQIVTSEDESTINKISSKVKVENPKGLKVTQKQLMIKKWQDKLECSNYELLTALRDWEEIVINKFGYLSNAIVNTFQETLNNYTQGDLDVALAIVKIATIQGYRDCQWAINVYEKDKQIKRNQQMTAQTRMPRVTQQKVATEDDISEEIIF